MTAHPRVGGEHAGAADRPHAAWRLIPAWAGNTGWKQKLGGTSLGSSPRGRGTLRDALRIGLVGRLIPAWAGNTPAQGSGSPRVAAHPRVGGEHRRGAHVFHPGAGSSPRGRGTPNRRYYAADAPRLIPAWAGNTSATWWRTTSKPAHPRVGGEHKSSVTGSSRASGSSPRGRGTQLGSAAKQGTHRLIPAWAGNTRVCGRSPRQSLAHPRVGGEHVTPQFLQALNGGSSPRGRGTLDRCVGNVGNRRLIPAWAGNTAWCGPARCEPAAHPRVGGEHTSSNSLI